MCEIDFPHFNYFQRILYDQDKQFQLELVLFIAAIAIHHEIESFFERAF